MLLGRLCRAWPVPRFAAGRTNWGQIPILFKSIAPDSDRLSRPSQLISAHAIQSAETKQGQSQTPRMAWSAARQTPGRFSGIKSARSPEDTCATSYEFNSSGSVDYSFDSVGRRTSMSVAGQPAVSYAYDSAAQAAYFFLILKTKKPPATPAAKAVVPGGFFV